MSFKLNVNATVFVPSSPGIPTSTILPKSCTPNQLWTQIQSLEAFTLLLIPKIQESNERIQSLQNELTAYFTLSYAFNNPVLHQLTSWKKQVKSLEASYLTLNAHLINMKRDFALMYPHYIHQQLPLPFLFAESSNSPSQMHDLLIFGYVRLNCTRQVSFDLIELLQSYITPFAQTEFVWTLNEQQLHILSKRQLEDTECPPLSNPFYCDDIEFQLSANPWGFHLHVRSFPMNTKHVVLSYQMQREYTAARFQNTAIFDGTIALDGCKIMKKTVVNATELILTAHVRILGIVYHDGSRKNNIIKMKRNFVYHWMMDDVLASDVKASRKCKKWHTNTFDDDNWCLSVYKQDKWRIRFGLKLLKLPHNVSKMAVRYGLNEQEYCMKVFSYDDSFDSSLGLWASRFNVLTPLDNFNLFVSVQIMAVFDMEGEYVNDWKRVGID